MKPETGDRKPATSALLIVVSAPSGAGKTTLCQQLLAARPGLTRAVTCTTRSPRPGEQDGVDYYFLDPASFASRLRRGDFLEHATVHENQYGTLKAEVLDKLRQGRDVLLNIDVQGAASVRQRAREDAGLKSALVSIFLMPPSFAVLEERLRKRGTDAPDTIEKRLAAARREMAEWKDFDFLLVSDSIAEDLRRALAIVEAEKLRASRTKPPAL